MYPESVPVIEVNPTNPEDVDMVMVPVEDIDDFLEDIALDYDLGLAELGAISGKANVKVKGSVKVAAPKVKAKGILAAVNKVAKVQAAIKSGLKVSKPQLKAAIKLKPIAKAVKKTAIQLAKKPIVKVAVKGKVVKVKPNVKLPSVKAKVVAKAASKVAAKVNKKIEKKAKAKSPKKILKVVKKKPVVAIKVAKGKFPAVPINKTAVARKTAAKHMAGQVAALAPKVRQGRKKALAAAVSGKAKRSAGLSQPVAVCIRAFQSQNVRPCIIAQKKPAGAALSTNQCGALRAKRKKDGIGKPMATKQFRRTIAKLLHAVECKCAATPGDTSAIEARVKRIRKITGVGNAA